MDAPAARSIAALSVTFLVVLALPASGSDARPHVRASSAHVGAFTRSRDTRVLPALASMPPDALTRALAQGGISEARYVLERALALFHPARVRAAYGRVATAAPRDPTLILRDLALRLGDLTPAQRAVARGILARPTDGASDPLGDGYTVPEATPVCDAIGCVHYVTTTEDAPALTDADLDGKPDYVESTLATLDEVWSAEVTGYGYRAPKSDLTSATNGGSGLIDVYLAELGDAGFYGYCTTDDPNADPATGYAFRDVSAYCVVDNDFDPAEFPAPGANGIQALQVTMAHEFFHAVQYAYDFGEDAWWMEGTASWMEDEVYTDVNDNLQYLASSPLSAPQRPLDRNNVFAKYGTWLFFRFLSEYAGSAGAPDPTIVRDAWENADAAPGGPDDYSTQAISKAIAARGGQFRFAFADFGMVNDAPGAWYSEGSAYPAPPLERRHTIGRANINAFGGFRMDHLTNRSVGFFPGRGVGPRDHLEVWVDLPPYRTGPEASLVTISDSGRVKYHPFKLDRAGDGWVRVPFGAGAIAEADLILTNASDRTRCWTDPSYTFSCAGQPRDDGLRYGYEAYWS